MRSCDSLVFYRHFTGRFHIKIGLHFSPGEVTAAPQRRQTLVTFVPVSLCLSAVFVNTHLGDGCETSRPAKLRFHGEDRASPIWLTLPRSLRLDGCRFLHSTHLASMFNSIPAGSHVYRKADKTQPSDPGGVGLLFGISFSINVRRRWRRSPIQRL